jgi:beta-glucosidase
MFDFWIAQGSAGDAVTILDGLKKRFAMATSLTYSKGYLPDGKQDSQLVEEAVSQAAAADLVIAVVGLSGKMAGEDRALAHPEIPQNQLDLLRALKKTGKPVIVLVTSGRPLVLTDMMGMADAVVACWILGTETGNAVADVLSGDYNPAGRTVMSFPYATGQIPVYYNHFNTGRPAAPGTDPSWKTRYRDIPREPLFPFGYGLSYTTFEYGTPRLDKPAGDARSNVQVTVTVTNTGKRAGEETVQLYIRDMTASIVRPVRELKNFSKIMLQPGESRTVTFIVRPEDLSFRDAAGNPVLEPGLFKIMVGRNAVDVQSADYTIK